MWLYFYQRLHLQVALAMESVRRRGLLRSLQRPNAYALATRLSPALRPLPHGVRALAAHAARNRPPSVGPPAAASPTAASLPSAPLPVLRQKPMLFAKILAGNRGEIAIRILRAASELGVPSVSMYSFEDRYSPHRYKADESFMVGRGLSPVAAYLNIPEIIKLAKENGVQAIHPGYGFLSENADFAEACARAGLVFIGPPAEVLRTFGDKTAARALAQKIGVPVVPGSPGPLSSVAEARAFIDTHGLPVIIKVRAWHILVACG